MYTLYLNVDAKDPVSTVDENADMYLAGMVVIRCQTSESGCCLKSPSAGKDIQLQSVDCYVVIQTWLTPMCPASISLPYRG